MKQRVQRNVILALQGVPQNPTRDNTFQIRRFASQTKPIQDCHPERSEGSLAPLRMTKRDGLLFEMYWPLWQPCQGGQVTRSEGSNNMRSFKTEECCT